MTYAMVPARLTPSPREGSLDEERGNVPAGGGASGLECRPDAERWASGGSELAAAPQCLVSG